MPLPAQLEPQICCFVLQSTCALRKMDISLYKSTWPCFLTHLLTKYEIPLLIKLRQLVDGLLSVVIDSKGGNLQIAQGRKADEVSMSTIWSSHRRRLPGGKRGPCDAVPLTIYLGCDPSTTGTCCATWSFPLWRVWSTLPKSFLASWFCTNT